MSRLLQQRVPRLLCLSLSLSLSLSQGPPGLPGLKGDSGVKGEKVNTDYGQTHLSALKQIIVDYLNGAECKSMCVLMRALIVD